MPTFLHQSKDFVSHLSAMSIGNGYTLYVLEDAKILGSGKFGAVCLGTIICDSANTKERNVAVKMLKGIKFLHQETQNVVSTI